MPDLFRIDILHAAEMFLRAYLMAVQTAGTAGQIRFHDAAVAAGEESQLFDGGAENCRDRHMLRPCKMHGAGIIRQIALNAADQRGKHR